MHHPVLHLLPNHPRSSPHMPIVCTKSQTALSLTLWLSLPASYSINNNNKKNILITSRIKHPSMSQMSQFRWTNYDMIIQTFQTCFSIGFL